MRPVPVLSLAIRRHAAAHPLALAIRDAAGDLSFGELDRAADATALALRESGVAPPDRVALLAVPSGEAIALLAGVVRAGAVVVPLGTRLTRREVADSLAETTPALLVHDADLVDLAHGHGVPALVPDALLARAGGAPRRRVDVDPDAPAVAILTSGTTGCPKAALLSHRALAASAAAWTSVLPSATGWLLCLGLAHVAGLGVAWRALGAGLPLHVVDAFDPEAVLAVLRGPDAPSHCSLVPVQLARLLAAAGEAGAAANAAHAAAGEAAAAANAAHAADGAAARGTAGVAAPPALRAILLGGAPIPSDLVRRATAAGWPVIPTYGLTEAGSGVTALPADETAATPESAGRPLPGVMLRIAEPGPDGVGEIEVHTPAAFSGYLGREAATAAAFTTDGWLRTGDLGRLDAAARLFVVDRRADLVVSGGENVYPAEVEAVLLAHPAIADAGVAGRPDPTWGAVPVAGIVLVPGAPDPGDDALRAWCRERLAPAKVPAAFLRLAALPRTASGKLRRRDLRDRLTPLVVLLHATLSNGRQLAPLARALAAPADLRLVAPDRRGYGQRRLDPPRAVAMDEHLADLAALLDAEGAGRAVLVGHSFGGVVALEAAARLPERVAAVVAYEPPYGPLADAAVRPFFDVVASETADGLARDGRAGAARAFLERVAGPGTWDAMPERARAFLATEGGGAVADAGMTGLDPDGLGSIVCPVSILTGGASEPFYAPIAEALAARIPGASRVDLPGLRHTAPITDPVAIAAAVRAALGRSDPSRLDAAPSPPDAPSGLAAERGNAAASTEVSAMFDRISGVYDPLNLVISAFQEPRWRRRAVTFAELKPGGRAIDIASGTGKVAADLHRAVQPGGEVVGVDISPGMIGIARGSFAGRPGLAFVVGDAMALPAEDDGFDAATIAFGMRNLPDYTRGFAEMARVVRPGGKVVCLEIARPRSRLARIMRWWFDRIVPLIGKVAGQGGAYAYLVRSVQNYPAPERIAEVMREAGLVGVRWVGMSGGIVTIHVGTVPPSEAFALAGAFRSRCHDTAATHDDALAEEKRW